MKKTLPFLIFLFCLAILVPALYALETGSSSSRERVILSALNNLENNNEPQPKIIPLIVVGENKSPSPSQSGAWGFKKGRLYLEVYSKYYWHKHYFDADGHKRKWDYGGEYSEIRIEPKLEYGLTDRLTLMVNAPYKEVRWKDDFAKYKQSGFPEVWPGIKYLLFTKPFHCALELRGKIPLDYDEYAVPALGSHQSDVEFKILTGQSWPKMPGYTKLEFGFRARDEEPANEIPYFFELGFNLTPKLILKTTVDGQKALNHRGQMDEDWTKATFGPIIKINEAFNLEFGYGNTFAGKNTAAAEEAYLTLYAIW